MNNGNLVPSTNMVSKEQKVPAGARPAVRDEFVPPAPLATFKVCRRLALRYRHFPLDPTDFICYSLGRRSAIITEHFSGGIRFGRATMRIWEVVGMLFVCALLLGVVKTTERRRAEKLMNDIWTRRIEGELSTLRSEVNQRTMAVDGLEGRGDSQAEQLKDMLRCLDEMARDMYPSLWRRRQESSNTPTAA